MIRLGNSGSTKNLEKFLTTTSRLDYTRVLHKYGKQGVAALRAETPVDTGAVASSWYYEIEIAPDRVVVSWKNSAVTKGGTPIAILIQYGHATGTGGYVQGRDYINPALQSIFDEIAESIWREVTNG